MYVDTVFLLAFLKPHDRHLEFAQKILESKENLYTSTATLIELSVVVKREISDFLSQNTLAAVMEKVPGLEIIPLDKKTFEASLELRKKFGFGIYDAIHASSALSKDKKIASTDHIFDKIPNLKRIGPLAD